MHASGCELIIKSSTQATYGDAPREEMPLHEGYNAEGTHRFASSNLAGGAWNGTKQSGPQIFERFLGALSAHYPNPEPGPEPGPEPEPEPEPEEG